MLNFGAMTLGASDLLSHVLPQPLFQVGGFTVTNHLLMGTVSAVLVVLVFWSVAGKVAVRGSSAEDYITRGQFAQLFETLLVFIREEVARPNLGSLTDKYIKYIWTVFFFILFCNVLGLVPLGYFLQLIGTFAGHEHPAHLSHWGGTATSNLSLNIPLALCSLIAIVFIGVRENGKHFFAHFAPVPFKPIGMAPIAVMLVALEIMGLLIKSAVLAMRLFGTMLAGHLVIAAMVGLIFTAAKVGAAAGYGVGVGVVLGSTVLMLLELFICFLQAFIFTFLTVLFISAGAVHHDSDEHDHHTPGPDEGGFERQHDRREPGHAPSPTEEAALRKVVEH